MKKSSSSSSSSGKEMAFFTLARSERMKGMFFGLSTATQENARAPLPLSGPEGWG